MNRETQEALPVNLIKEQMSESNFKTNSFKVLQSSILYNNNNYNYIIPATTKGLNFINTIFTNSKDVLFVAELNVYLV